MPPGAHSDGTKDRLSWRTIVGIVVFVAVLGLTTGFLFFARFHDFYTNDSYSYVDAASNLANGRGFTNSAGFPEVTRTPGYPLLIVPFLWLNLGVKGVVIFQHLLRVAIAVATVLVAFHLTGSRKQALVAGIVVCLDLPMTEAANTIMTEILFTLALGGVLWLLWESAKQSRAWVWSLVPGFSAGLATLIRPAGLFFLVPAAVYLLVARPTFKLRAALCFVLAFACPLLLWGARNYSRTGSFTLFPIAAWDMLGYRAAGVLAINDPGDFYENMERRRNQLVNEVCTETQPVFGPDCTVLIAPQSSVPEKSVYYMRLGRKIVFQHPFAYVKLAVRGSAVIMLGENANRVAQLVGVAQRTAAKALLSYTVPALGFALIGMWRYWRTSRSLFFLLFLTMIYFVVVTAGAEGYSRYRVPVMPVYAILIAAGFDFVAGRWFRQSTSQAA